MIFLKRIKQVEDDRKNFALLVMPDLSGFVHSDAELYEMTRNVDVTILPIFCFAPCGEPVTMTGREFATIWKGD